MAVTQDLIAQNASLQQKYAFVRPVEVEVYLQQYPFLVPLLEAPTKIYQYFPNAPLYLEVVFYQDGLPGENTCFLGIVPDVEPEEAVATLWKLDEEWWDDVPANIREKMELTIGWL